MVTTPHVYSIAPGVPFLETLFRSVMDGTLYPEDQLSDNSSSLADLTIFLPTRRASHFLSNLFARSAKAGFLPEIKPLAEISGEDDIIPATSLKQYQVISHMHRQLLLAGLVHEWHKVLKKNSSLVLQSSALIGGRPAEHFELAEKLAALLDTFTIHGVTAEHLEAVSPRDQDKFWDITHSFLQIVTKHWPKILEEQNLSDPAATQVANLVAIAKEVHKPDFNRRIIIAGSTGSMPATATFMAAVAHSRTGRIILPGLDFLIPDSVFKTLQSDTSFNTHPQYFMARALNKIGISRADVKKIGTQDATGIAREWLISHALLPAEATDAWFSLPGKKDNITKALHHIALIEGADEEQECKAIAVAIRGKLETPEKIIALITPNRKIAARVTAELERWNIFPIDTADEPFVNTPSGQFLMTIAEWMAAPPSPEAISGMLQQKNSRFGFERIVISAVCTYLDLNIFRDHAQPRTVNDIIAAVMKHARVTARPDAPIDDVSSTIADDAVKMLTKIEEICQKFNLESSIASFTLYDCIEAHCEIAQVVLDAGARDINFADDIVRLIDILQEHQSLGPSHFKISFQDYVQILPALLGKLKKPVVTRSTDRVVIYGLLEARLISADCIILAGLDEQSWPVQPAPDDFMTRGMRGDLNLPQVETSIGQAAHDFAQALTASSDIILTRSEKSDGTPTVASRFLQRLAALAGNDNPDWSAARERGEHFIRIANKLDTAVTPAPVSRPAPVPDRIFLPARITVTDAEKLVRDPYSYYARRILRLNESGVWGRFPGAQMRGNILHAAMATLAENILPAEFFEQSWNDRIDELLHQHGIPQNLAVFWRPVFHSFGKWFLEWNQMRRLQWPLIGVEKTGALDLSAEVGHPLILVARADRIEGNGDFRSIVDFKTGRAPTAKEVVSGLAPQMTLEAAMIALGAFGAEWRQSKTSELLYVNINVNKGSAREIKIPSGDKADIDAMASDQLQYLCHRWRLHLDGKFGFKSKPSTEKNNISKSYHHLSRVAEWGRIQEAEGDE